MLALQWVLLLCVPMMQRRNLPGLSLIVISGRWSGVAGSRLF
jgi:hypothetical protein